MLHMYMYTCTERYGTIRYDTTQCDTMPTAKNKLAMIALRPTSGSKLRANASQPLKISGYVFSYGGTRIKSTKTSRPTYIYIYI